MAGFSEKRLVLNVSSGFSYVALWQGAGFLILVLLVWVNELTDFPALMAGRPPSPPDIFRGCLSSAGVFFAAIITIGQTYLQQRNIVSGLITICLYCHKVQVNKAVWQRVEEYIGKHSSAFFSHGVCPECFDKAKQDAGLD